jgi:hypothetical protein
LIQASEGSLGICSGAVVLVSRSRTAEISLLRPNNRLALGLSEKGMQLRHHLGSFADRCGDPLDRTRANITNSEHPTAAGLQRMAPFGGLCTGEHESLGVKRNCRATIKVRQQRQSG